jgi:hypothetical protein
MGSGHLIMWGMVEITLFHWFLKIELLNVIKLNVFKFGKIKTEDLCSLKPWTIIVTKLDIFKFGQI